MFYNLEEVMIANEESGFKTFDPEVTSQFNGRIESDLFLGKYFVTWESNKLSSGKFYEGYSVREVLFPSGQIYKVGESREFKSREDALIRIEELSKGDRGLPSSLRKGSVVKGVFCGQTS